MIAFFAVLFVAAGSFHFIRPAFYLAIMPPWLSRPAFWVWFTGLCEIAGGLGLLVPALRAPAAWGLIALLVGVFPANVYMLQKERVGAPPWKVAALAARLPLQGLLIYGIWAAALAR